MLLFVSMLLLVFLKTLHQTGFRKQNDPGFVANDASSGGSASNSPEGGVDHKAADDDFDAALEKRRKRRREMNADAHNKLNRLVDVAAR